MRDAEIDRLLDRLARPGMSLAEAETLIGALDGREVWALPAVFRALHDAPTPARLNAAVQILRRWADLPVAAALPNALRALIGEAAVADLNKIAAAGLLAVLGQPIDDRALAAALDDPGALAAAALGDAVAASRSPAVLARFIDAVAGWDERRVIDLCDDLAGLGDPAASHILGCIACRPDHDVAIAAIAAIDGLAAAGAARLVALVAAAHPDERVRRQASLTLRRLGGDGAVRRAGRPAAGAADAPLTRAWLSPDGAARAVVLARPVGAGDGHDVYTAIAGDEGVVSYAAAERVDDRGLAYIVAQLAAGGLPAAAVDVEAAAAVLAAATATTMAADGAHAIGFAAWAAWLPDGRAA